MDISVSIFPRNKLKENDMVQLNGKSCEKSLETKCNVYTVYHYF